MSREAQERQRAFTGLLTHPVIDRYRHPDLWPLVRRHRVILTEWFSSRLGYRLVVTEAGARLFRLPSGGRVLAPRPVDPPPRRALVLAILAAAAAEDAEDVTTTQDLSDRVRALSRHDEVPLAGYDPDRFAERQQFVRAVGILIMVGALRPVGRGADDQREGWAHHRHSIGGAYRIERELLLRMVDPTCLESALGAEAPQPEVRFAVMRRLLELPLCLLDDLDDAERAYLANQRHRIIAWCDEMTGWVVEQRREGLALIAPAEQDTDLAFPRLRAVDFATLMMLDDLRRVAADAADGLLDDLDVHRAAGRVRLGHPKAMTKDLDSDAAVADRTMEMMRALDLVRPVSEGCWRLTAAAARFRSPTVVATGPTLDEEQP